MSLEIAYNNIYLIQIKICFNILFKDCNTKNKLTSNQHMY